MHLRKTVRVLRTALRVLPVVPAVPQGRAKQMHFLRWISCADAGIFETTDVRIACQQVAHLIDAFQ